MNLASPNFGGVVVKADGITAAVDAWVEVRQWNGNWWDWVGGSNAQPSGSGESLLASFAMFLTDDGEYEVEIWPSWTDTESVNSRTSITITDGVATCTEGAGGCDDTGGTFTLSFPASNISGMLLQAGGETGVSWSGIEVLEDVNGDPGDGWFGGDAEEWVGWMHVGDTGASDVTNFKGQLDPGDYTLIGFPSWSDNESQPTSFEVTVDSDDPTIVSCSSPCTSTDSVLSVTLKSGALSGTVTSSNETPLANGLVFLYNDSNEDGHGTLGVEELIRDTATDANGNYSLLIEEGDCSTNWDEENPTACVVSIQPPPLVGDAVDVDTVSDSFQVWDNNSSPDPVDVTMTAASL